jgi:3'-5' exoribonuclease
MPQGGKIVLIEGVVEDYQNNTQIKLTHAEIDETAPPDLFVVGTRHTIELLEETFQKLMNRVHHRGLQTLLHESFTAEVMARFRRWPAAVRHHGAVVGGLLEHTVNVTYIAERLTQLYSCNQELVLAGALLHDIGKTGRARRADWHGVHGCGQFIRPYHFGGTICAGPRPAGIRA